MSPGRIYLFLLLNEGRTEPGDGAEEGQAKLTRGHMSWILGS